MKTIVEKNCKVLSVRYKNHSVYGNPSYYVSFETRDGKYYMAKTCTNGMCGYEAQNCRYYPDSTYTITFHTTRSGYTIIDFLVREH